MIIGRITAKAQTTIPQAVRRALGLKPGDRLAYQLEEGRVILTRAEAAVDNPFASFSEWSSEADERAYRDL